MIDYIFWIYLIVTGLFTLITVFYIIYAISRLYKFYYVGDLLRIIFNKNKKEDKKYLIREDSAHTGKQSVIVTKLHDKTIEKYLKVALEIRFDFGDEVVYYDIINDNDMFTTKFMDEWNLFNSLYLENTYKNNLDKQYYKGK